MINRLTLDQLSIFVTIAESGSFSAASRQLNRAQSGISQAIKNLESMQGITLFNREEKYPRLTTDGKLLLEAAKKVLSSANKFEKLAAFSRQGIESELSIAVDPLVPMNSFIPVLQALNKRFPHLSINIFSDGLGVPEQRLRAQEVDIALCVYLPTIPENISVKAIDEIEMVAVVSTDHELANIKEKLTFDMLKNYVQLVLAYAEQDNEKSYGVLSQNRWRFIDLSRRLDCLLNGLGWCRMPLHYVKSHINNKNLVILDIEDDPARFDPNIRIYASHLTHKKLGPVGTFFIEQFS